MFGDCCCGKPTFDGDVHPTPCFVCRAKAGLCECCGDPGRDWSPYGFYCDPCADDITHPTGNGSCFVTDGREHWQAPSTPESGSGTGAGT